MARRTVRSRGRMSPSNPAAHNVPRPPAEQRQLRARQQQREQWRRRRTAQPHGNAGASTAQNPTVPRPPANYTYHSPSGTPQQSAPSHQSAPSQHAAPQGNSHGNGSAATGRTELGATSRAYGSAPRPPAGYTYHAAPAYSGSSSYAAGRSGVSGYSGSRGSTRLEARITALAGATDRVRRTAARSYGSWGRRRTTLPRITRAVEAITRPVAAVAIAGGGGGGHSGGRWRASIKLEEAIAAMGGSQWPPFLLCFATDAACDG